MNIKHNTTSKSLSISRKKSKKNTKNTVNKNISEKLNKSEINYKDDEIVIWKEGYFGLTQNINEKRGPKYKCTECLSFFNTRLSFFTHSQYHSKPFCILCGFYTNTENEMVNHKINNHKQFIEIIKPENDKNETNITSLDIKSRPEGNDCGNSLQIGCSVVEKPNTGKKTALIAQPIKISTNDQFISIKEKLMISNNTQHGIDLNKSNCQMNQNFCSTPKLFGLPIKENNTVNSNRPVSLEQKIEFMENSSYTIPGSETKEQRINSKENLKLKIKFKNEDRTNSVPFTPKTKFSRSGRCITMKSFDY